MATALDIAIMAGSVIWTERHEKRGAPDRLASYRGRFTLDPMPLPATEIQILVDGDSGMPVEVEAMQWPPLGWVDVATLL